jgi:hypothetical protein
MFRRHPTRPAGEFGHPATRRRRAAQVPAPGGPAGKGLEAAAQSTGAVRPVRVEGNVTEFARPAVRSGVEATAENQTGADAGRHREVNHIGEAAAGAEAPFRKGRGVGIVLEHDG